MTADAAVAAPNAWHPSAPNFQSAFESNF